MKVKRDPTIDRFLFALRKTAASVADELGMSRQLFHQKKNGDVRFADDELRRLAIILGVRLSDIAEED